MSDNVTIKLSNPITREGGNSIEELILRKPNTGELRGIKIADLIQLDVVAVSILLTRICQPTITTEQINKLDLPDLISIGNEIVGFFVPANTPTT